MHLCACLVLLILLMPCVCVCVRVCVCVCMCVYVRRDGHTQKSAELICYKVNWDILSLLHSQFERCVDVFGIVYWTDMLQSELRYIVIVTQSIWEVCRCFWHCILMMRIRLLALLVKSADIYIYTYIHIYIYTCMDIYIYICILMMCILYIDGAHTTAWWCAYDERWGAGVEYHFQEI